MIRIAQRLWNDTSGLIISAELVIVATVLVIGLIVGMNSVQCAVVQEYQDVGSAIGSLNQSYVFSGLSSTSSICGIKARTFGSVFFDRNHYRTTSAVSGLNGYDLGLSYSNADRETDPSQTRPDFECFSSPPVETPCPDEPCNIQPGCSSFCRDTIPLSNQRCPNPCEPEPCPRDVHPPEPAILQSGPTFIP